MVTGGEVESSILPKIRQHLSGLIASTLRQGSYIVARHLRDDCSRPGGGTRRMERLGNEHRRARLVAACIIGFLAIHALEMQVIEEPARGSVVLSFPSESGHAIPALSATNEPLAEGGEWARASPFHA